MRRKARVIVCDDDELIRWSVAEYLRGCGYDITDCEDGEQCLKAVAEQDPALVLLDLKMPRMDGLTCLRRLRESENRVPVVVLTAYGALESAIEATRLGADAYLTKPCDLREVAETVGRILEASRARQVAVSVGAPAVGRYHTLIGRSQAMERVFEKLRKLESIDAPTVMIIGESGTGKDLVARAIHANGPRTARPFMEIDCTAIPEGLVESTLFGHERGAFTDAKAQRRGLFEAARGGVAFLDEIGEMSLPIQAKLLRALENRRFKRVGGNADIDLDAGIIVATHRDLRAEVAAARFREDLFYRLAVVLIRVPPLRERGSDIGLLATHFIEHFNRAFGRNVQGVSGEALAALERYSWPGNVRELRNVVERIVIFHEEPIVQLQDLPSEIRLHRGGYANANCPFVLPENGVELEAVERGLLEQALERTQGNQSAAARLLGLTRYALRYRMEKYGLMKESG